MSKHSSVCHHPLESVTVESVIALCRLWPSVPDARTFKGSVPIPTGNGSGSNRADWPAYQAFQLCVSAFLLHSTTSRETPALMSECAAGQVCWQT